MKHTGMTLKRVAGVMAASVGLALLAIPAGVSHAAVFPSEPGAGTVQVAAVQAIASNQLELIGQYQMVYVIGENFVTNGQPVSLQAYGVVGGRKIFLGAAQRTPDPQTGIFGWSFQQAQDPCTGDGYAQVEVDAYLTRTMVLQQSLHTAQAVSQFRVIKPSTFLWTELATATATVGCPTLY